MSEPQAVQRAFRGQGPDGRISDTCDHVVFATEDVILGEFRCPATHPDFAGAGPIHHHVVAFPREAVWIEREDAPRFVADPAVATLYNPRQAYRRSPISRGGDRSDWIGVSERLARDLVRGLSRADAERDETYRHARAAVPCGLYSAQRAVFGSAREPGADPLEIEERAIGILGAVLQSAYGVARSGPVTIAGRAVVEDARAAIMARLFENLSVRQLASLVGVSPFHLCRVFSAATGTTLHAYRRDMRLRTVLGMTATYRGNLAALALEAGFSSHSHFTTAFRRAFGRVPSLLDEGPGFLTAPRR